MPSSMFTAIPVSSANNCPTAPSNIISDPSLAVLFFHLLKKWKTIEHISRQPSFLIPFQSRGQPDHCRLGLGLLLLPTFDRISTTGLEEKNNILRSNPVE